MDLNARVLRLRREYSGEPLDVSTVDADPFRQLTAWLEAALKAELPDPHAMVVATSTRAGAPSARVVLLRGLDARGLVFYTNYTSRKSREALENPRAAALFVWLQLDRQVRVEGSIEKISPEESDEYFKSRPRENQIAAWSSEQSSPIRDRAELEKLFEEFKRRFTGKEVTRPRDWGGLRIVPNSFEFWQGRENRLHDRVLYTRDKSGGWSRSRLAP